jgi:hypothetical protein
LLTFDSRAGNTNAAHLYHSAHLKIFLNDAQTVWSNRPNNAREFKITRGEMSSRFFTLYMILWNYVKQGYVVNQRTKSACHQTLKSITIETRLSLAGVVASVAIG